LVGSTAIYPEAPEPDVSIAISNCGEMDSIRGSLRFARTKARVV
jgi:hypothetical protein